MEQNNAVTPEFCSTERLYELTGLKRSQAYQLAAEGKIKTVCLLRRPDAVKGKRLWNVPSVLEYLRSQMKEGGVK